LGYKTFPPDLVVIPSDAEELASVVRALHEAGVPICLRGAGTSLAGGPVAAQGGAIIHTSRLRAIREINTAGLWCEVECGVTLSSLDEALKSSGLHYPPDPSSGPVCTIGGNVASNAGGAHCFRYGVTGNYVLGVEVVMLDGTLRRFGGPAGGRGPWREDWKRFMVGSEGTLGAFMRFWLRLTPRPEKAWTFRAAPAEFIVSPEASFTTAFTFDLSGGRATYRQITLCISSDTKTRREPFISARKNPMAPPCVAMAVSTQDSKKPKIPHKSRSYSLRCSPPRFYASGLTTVITQRSVGPRFQSARSFSQKASTPFTIPAIRSRFP
jgi:hypothetical protein